VRKVTEPCAGTEIVITLEHEGSGTKVTIVQSGFGAMWTFAADALEVGWRHIVADLALYLERGVHGSRHIRRWGNFGCVFRDTDFGLEVVSAMGDSFAQRVGLTAGDIVIAVAGAPVVTRAELESLMRVLPSGETVEVEWVRADAKLEAEAAVRARRLRSGVGQQRVDLLAGVGDDLGDLGDLIRVSGHCDLLRSEMQLAERITELLVPAARIAAAARPRRSAGLGHALGCRGATLVGELVDPFAISFFRAHKPLVLEQLQGRIDRAGARPPCALGLLLEPLDQLVAMGRRLGEHRQHCGADVASPATAAASDRHLERPWSASVPASSVSFHTCVTPVYRCIAIYR
jgi:hypothetical protein